MGGGISDATKSQFNLFAEEYLQKNASIIDAASKTRMAFGELDGSILAFAQITKKGSFSLQEFEKFMAAGPSKAAKFIATIQSMALNMAAIAAITLVIKGVVWAVDSLIVTTKEAEEELEKSNAAYEEGAKKLEDLQKQLNETSSKMQELESGGITVIEQSEYDRLVETNKELERNVALQKIRNETNLNENADNAVRFYQKKTHNASVSLDDIQKIANNENLGQTLLSVDEGDINSQLGAYIALKNAISDTKLEIDSLFNSTGEVSEAQLQELQYRLDSSEDA